MKITPKKIEVFCGTGGVGKTTLATARALALAKEGYRVFLITIDPAKRLKQILNLKDDQSGEVVSISKEVFSVEQEKFHFDAMLMSPHATLQRMGMETGTTKELENKIIKILTRPYGGMNEIMAIIEVQQRLASGHYDTIILDTPPGKHFIDFLEASKKIDRFFDQSFIDIFNYLGKTVGKESSAPKKVLGQIISSGIRKLLTYLEKVTGPEFVDTFIDAIVAIFKNRGPFLAAIHFQKDLKKQEISNWFLVTSAEQHKINDAQDLKNMTTQFMHDDNYLAINKCLSGFLRQWQVETGETQLQAFRDLVLSREQDLISFAGHNFLNRLEFPEILDLAPREHVIELAEMWKQWSDRI